MELIRAMAEKGNPTAYPFTLPLTRVKSLDFSYSGIKTAVLRCVQKITMDGTKPLSRIEVANIAASFQRVAIQHLLQRTLLALQRKKVHSVILGGGVSANLLLRKELRKLLRRMNVPFYFPANKKLCSDNAAMIAIAAYYRAQKKDFVKDIETVDRDPVARLS